MPFTFLLHSFCATGHVLPMQAVARMLVDRGHRVVWIADAHQESRVLASGAEFMPTRDIALADAALLSGQPETLEETAEVLFGSRVTAQVSDFRRTILTLNLQVDCLLIDALTYGAAALFELGEVPSWATLGVVPMYTSNCEFQPRSALGMLLSMPELALPCINAQRAHLGLRPWEADDFSNYSPLLHLQASCATLEYDQLPRQTHYIGPLVMRPNKTKSDTQLPSWWNDIESHPCMVGITQGTFAVNPYTLLIPAIEALCNDPDLLLVVPSPYAESISQTLFERDLDLTNVRLAEWVPYSDLLPRCRLLVTNGGYGSVTQALSHGVPLICAGTSEDKKDTAARLTWIGAGIDLKTDTPAAIDIRRAVRSILEDDKYRNNAFRVGQELCGLGGAKKAGNLLEMLVTNTLVQEKSKLGNMEIGGAVVKDGNVLEADLGSSKDVESLVQ